MSHLIEEIKETVEETLAEEEIISHNRHHFLSKLFLILRNITAAIAVSIFIFSLFLHSHAYTLKAVAYFIGAFTYLCEYLLLTDFFRTKIPHNELFMIYCFGPMYILLGISYIFK